MALEEQIVSFRAIAATDDVDVARTLGDDQRRLRALALDQRVDGDGRAVDQFIDGVGRKPALADAVEDALRQLVRRGEALGLDELPTLSSKPTRSVNVPPMSIATVIMGPAHYGLLRKTQRSQR